MHAVTLSWPTFTAAANEAGISRIFHGIHFDDGNERSFGRQKNNREIGILHRLQPMTNSPT